MTAQWLEAVQSPPSREHLVLIAAGLDPYGVVVVEAGHVESGASYSRALEAYAEGSVAGVRAWLLRCAAAVADSLHAGGVAGKRR